MHPDESRVFQAVRIPEDLRIHAKSGAGAYRWLRTAGHAMEHELMLVTGNIREFSRVEGLTTENWS